MSLRELRLHPFVVANTPGSIEKVESGFGPTPTHHQIRRLQPIAGDLNHVRNIDLNGFQVQQPLARIALTKQGEFTAVPQVPSDQPANPIVVPVDGFQNLGVGVVEIECLHPNPFLNEAVVKERRDEALPDPAPVLGKQDEPFGGIHVRQ